MSRSIVQHGLRYGLALGLAAAGVAGLVQPQVTAAQSTVNLDLLALEPLTAEEAAEYVYEGILPSLDLLVAPVTVPDAELREEVEEYIAVQEELAALEEEPTATAEPTEEPTVEPTAAPNPTCWPTSRRAMPARGRPRRTCASRSSSATFAGRCASGSSAPTPRCGWPRGGSRCGCPRR
jgi:hypothetical protein